MSQRAVQKLEWFAWYEFDYTADTSHLSREEDYAYWRIMREIFRTAQDSCRIRDDDDYLRSVARCSREEWPSIRRALIDGARPLLRKRGSWISQTRLTIEIRKAQEKSAQARRAVAERERRRNSTSSDDDHPFNGGSSSKRERKKKKQPAETTSPSVGERETTTTARGRAIEATARDVSRWLDAHPGALQCLHCAPHAPHAPGRCTERPRFNGERCDCQEEGQTRLSATAAVEFHTKFQRTYEEWCSMRDVLRRSA